MIFELIPVAFYCISRRQLVGVGVESGPGFISISPAHLSRSRSSRKARNQKGDLTSRKDSEVLAVDSVGG